MHAEAAEGGILSPVDNAVHTRSNLPREKARWARLFILIGAILKLILLLQRACGVYRLVDNGDS